MKVILLNGSPRLKKSSTKGRKKIGAVYLEKVKKAGKEVIKKGAISQELQEELNNG